MLRLGEVLRGVYGRAVVKVEERYNDPLFKQSVNIEGIFMRCLRSS